MAPMGYCCWKRGPPVALPQLSPMRQGPRGQIQQMRLLTHFHLAPRRRVSPAAGYIICWAFQPSNHSDYNVYVGTFQLGGPNVLSGSSCVKGENCIITLTGIGFANTNKILVIDTSSSCGASAVAATFSAQAWHRELYSKESQTAQTGFVENHSL